MIEFYDDEHERSFQTICKKMKCLECYQLSMAYLLALDIVLREHIEDVFDFEENCIRPDALHKGWQTGTSRRTIRLAFNLWNGYAYEGETYIDKDGYENDLPSTNYTPAEIFCCNCNYAPYYWQAIQIRFERV